MSLLLPPNYLGRPLGTRSGSVIATVKTTVDTVTSSASAGNITGLALVIPPNITAIFRFILPFKSAGTGVGMKFGLSYDDTIPSVCSTTINVPTGANGSAALFTGVITGSGGLGGSTSVSSSLVVYTAWADGIIKNGSSSVTLQGQVAASTGGTNVTIVAPAIGWAMEV